MNVKATRTELYEVRIDDIEAPTFREASGISRRGMMEWQPTAAWFRWERRKGEEWRLVERGTHSSQVLVDGKLGRNTKRHDFSPSIFDLPLERPKPPAWLTLLENEHHPRKLD